MLTFGSQNCDLSGCDLQEANLRGSNVKGAIFEEMLTPLHMSQSVRWITSSVFHHDQHTTSLSGRGRCILLCTKQFGPLRFNLQFLHLEDKQFILLWRVLCGTTVRLQEVKTQRRADQEYVQPVQMFRSEPKRCFSEVLLCLCLKHLNYKSSSGCRCRSQGRWCNILCSQPFNFWIWTLDLCVQTSTAHLHTLVMQFTNEEVREQRQQTTYYCFCSFISSKSIISSSSSASTFINLCLHHLTGALTLFAIWASCCWCAH